MVGANAPDIALDSGALEPSEPIAAWRVVSAAAQARAAAASVSTLDELVAACGSGLLTSAGDQTLDRHPYLQQVTSTSALVLFTTRDVGPDPVLKLTRPSGQPVELFATEADPQDASGHQRMARLTRLEPDTVYCYELDDWLSPVGFRTAPLSGSGAPVRFIAFGDSGGDRRELVLPAMARARFDLILHVGDIAYYDGSVGNFETKFFDTYAALLAHAPIFPASGNHEYLTRDAAPYRQVFALPENGGPDGVERWFSYDWGDVHFIALDTEQVGPVQAGWLEADLARNTLPWKVVYMHKPPYSSGVHGSSLDVRETFSPAFERFGVQLVLSGHDHDYERMNVMGGVTYVVTGGGGYSIRPITHSDFTAHIESTFQFMRGEVGPNELSLVAVDASGTEIDGTRIPRVPLVDPR